MNLFGNLGGFDSILEIIENYAQIVEVTDECEATNIHFLNLAEFLQIFLKNLDVFPRA